MIKQRPTFYWQLLHPKWLPTWFFVLILFSLSLLPWRWQLAIGRQVGRMLFPLFKSRRHVALRNIELCFPEKTHSERLTLIKKNFENMGVALLESAMSWWWPAHKVAQFSHFEGYEHIQKSLAQGKGVLLLCGHFLCVEMIARVIGLTHPSSGFYRPQKNAVIEFFQCRGRLKGNRYLVDKKDVKGLIQLLNEGEVCVYLPDQDYGRNRCEFVPFFSVKNTPTTTGTLLFAEHAHCDVMTLVTWRDKQGYHVKVEPAFAHFPSGDNKADVTQVNQWVERAVLNAPEQYYWVHRRFKTRPNPEDPSLY